MTTLPRSPRIETPGPAVVRELLKTTYREVRDSLGSPEPRTGQSRPAAFARIHCADKAIPVSGGTGAADVRGPFCWEPARV